MKDLDKYVEEKAKALRSRIDSLDTKYKGLDSYIIPVFKDFIRTIIEDCKPKVNKEFLEEHKRNIESGKMSTITALKYALLKAGVEVEE